MATEELTYRLLRENEGLRAIVNRLAQELHMNTNHDSRAGIESSWRVCQNENCAAYRQAVFSVLMEDS